MDEELQERCIAPGRLRPIDSRPERRRTAQNLGEMAARFLRAARNLLDTDTPEQAVIQGYFAMEHKANQWLAVLGYRSKDHVCTQMALSRIAGRKDLAGTLSRAYEDRLAFNYTWDPGGLRSATEPAGFVEAAHAFLRAVDEEISARDA